MANLGFIGLGEMGSRVAVRLHRAGHTLTVYNRTRAKAEPLLALGMAWADTPRAVAERADVVFSMVADTAALRAVTYGDDGLLAGLGPGKVYVDMSTVSPQAIRELSAEVAERGAAMLESPVSGGRELHVPLPTTAAANEMLSAARGMGLGDHDFAALFDALARMAGVDVTR